MYHRAPRFSCVSGDLGSIDAKYDVAVSTAAPQLDYMVVADTGTAQRCIELLRKQGLGVATFLMLDKQAHLATQAGQPVQPPEGSLTHTLPDGGAGCRMGNLHGTGCVCTCSAGAELGPGKLS